MAEDYKPKADYNVDATGGHAYWRHIDDIPAPVEFFEAAKYHAYIRQTIKDHAAHYQLLGYGVRLDWSDDEQDADLWIDYPKKLKAVTAAAIDVLKGALGATVVKASWGGGR